VLYVTHPAFGHHDTGPLHPERTARLRAVEAGVEESGLPIRRLSPIPANRGQLERVHTPAYVDALERFCRQGGGHLDADTVVGPESWEAALLAAGAGPVAAAELAASSDPFRLAFLSVRPPGHHATADRAMGFCLLNNVAICAALLADDGARVAIVDWDVHHGNGTQDMFFADPRVLYVSIHQFPFYPYQGQVEEVGVGEAEGNTINLPLPAGSAGDAYRASWEAVVGPILGQFQPDWLLISAGYDAHAEDPLAEMRLEAPDYGWMAIRLRATLPSVPVVLFLEGGYHLPALTSSVASTLRGFSGETPAIPTGFRSPPEAFRVIERVRAVAGRYWSL
jgi:acetoin utilization deacetylase AcuC-like enzyme